MTAAEAGAWKLSARCPERRARMSPLQFTSQGNEHLSQWNQRASFLRSCFKLKQVLTQIAFPAEPVGEPKSISRDCPAFKPASVKFRTSSEISFLLLSVARVPEEITTYTCSRGVREDGAPPAMLMNSSTVQSFSIS